MALDVDTVTHGAYLFLIGTADHVAFHQTAPGEAEAYGLHPHLAGRVCGGIFNAMVALGIIQSPGDAHRVCLAAAQSHAEAWELVSAASPESVPLDHVTVVQRAVELARARTFGS